jgi:CDP-diacylglycerol--glycerol-3-phosphate 3-phosphatidyltransferase
VAVSQACSIRANLSEQYFTNRQDRYVWMKNNADIADFYAKFIDTIGSFSFQINATSKDSVLVMSDPKCPDPSKDPDNFRVESGKRLIDFWTRYLKASPKPSLVRPISHRESSVLC